MSRLCSGLKDHRWVSRNRAVLRPIQGPSTVSSLGNVRTVSSAIEVQSMVRTLHGTRQLGFAVAKVGLAVAKLGLAVAKLRFA
jgi:hypothetical protein